VGDYPSVLQHVPCSASSDLQQRVPREKPSSVLGGFERILSWLLGESRISDFEEAMDLRESADYGSAYTEEDARNLVRKAQEFLEKVKRILKP